MTPRDYISGLLTPIIMIASTLSYSALIFSGPLAGQLPLGIGFGLISASLTALIFAYAGQIHFGVAGPDSKPVAVLAIMAAAIASECAARGETAAIVPTVLIGLISGTLLTGILLYLFGTMKIGRWIRYVPYPVIAGFIAATGWFLCAGSVRVFTGVSLTPEHVLQFFEGQHPQQLLVGAGFTIAMILIRRLNNLLAFPALLLAGTVAVLLALNILGISIHDARATGWLLDTSMGAEFPNPWFSNALRLTDYEVLLHNTGAYIVLVIVTAFTLLLSIVAIEVDARMDIDVDRELRVNGLSNIVVGLAGGMVGTLSVSRTTFNYKIGARHRGSGFLAGTICLAILVWGTNSLGYVPIPLLGALLLQSGLGMLTDWLYLGWSRMQRSDYFQMIVILLSIVGWGFMPGIGVGILAACVTFAINSSRINLVKSELTRSDYASRVERSTRQQELLSDHGQGIRIMLLQGFVFFGSVNRLLLDIKSIFSRQNQDPCRMIILDFRQVLNIDSSSVMSLIKIRHLAEREGFILVVSSLPIFVEKTLQLGGLLVSDNDPVVKKFIDLDTALEWCEERVLEENTSREEAIRSADSWLSREIGDPALFSRLVSYLEMNDYAQGDTLFVQGDDADSLYMIYTGRVSVIYRASNGTELRLRSMASHTIVGEMGLYRDVPRGATVKADRPTIVYRMSIEATRQMEQDDPGLAYAFHRFVIRTLASRLDFANREIAALQR